MDAIVDFTEKLISLKCLQLRFGTFTRDQTKSKETRLLRTLDQVFTTCKSNNEKRQSISYTYKFESI